MKGFDFNKNGLLGAILFKPFTLASIKRDFEKGWSFLEQATEKVPGQAYSQMGEIYLKGIGVDIDKEKALEYYKLSLKAKGIGAESKIKDIENDLGIIESI